MDANLAQSEWAPAARLRKRPGCPAGRGVQNEHNQSRGNGKYKSHLSNKVIFRRSDQTRRQVWFNGWRPTELARQCHQIDEPDDARLQCHPPGR